MLSLTVYLLLLSSVASGIAITSRDEPKLSEEAIRALEEAKVDLSKPHVKPTQEVYEILAVGDSYTAGIGSNAADDEIGPTDCSRYSGAWPVQLSEKDDWFALQDHKPKLTFGACSGDVMYNVREGQLKLGDTITPDLDHKYTPIGKPQIAVLTISGNDAKFYNIVNDCIFRVPWKTGPLLACEQRLDEVNALVDKIEFKYELMQTYGAVITAGRLAKGADPPESFQAYVGGYVGLFNHDDPDCDNVYWNIFRWGISYKQWLTRDLRLKLNHLTDKLNSVIKSAAMELERYGVIYVEGYNEHFMDARFCEKRPHCIHGHLFQDNSSETKIWSYRSKMNGTEGKPVAETCTDPHDRTNKEGPAEDDYLDRLAEILVPNEEERKQLSNEKGPADVSEGNWDQYDTLEEAIMDRGPDKLKAKAMKDETLRMFHPKKSGYEGFANKWMEAIKANRDGPASPPPPPPPPPKPEEEKPQQKTKALVIILEFLITVLPPSEMHWLYFETNYGEAVGCRDRYHETCRAKTDSRAQFGDIDANPMPVTPGGTVRLHLFGEDCEYMNDGNSNGRLFCPSVEGGIDCKDEAAKNIGKDGTEECGVSDAEGSTRHPAIVCEW